jgi:sugar phosphate isomerase/epimerase
MTPCDLLQKAVDLGVSVVQVADNMPLDRLDEFELGRFRDQARASGITLELGASGIAAENLLTHLRLAGRLQARILRTVIDCGNDRPDVERVIECLKELAPAFEQADVLLAVENHDRFRAATLKRVLDAVGSDHVGICLDTANSIGCVENLETLLAVLGPRIVNVHLKDYEIFRPPHLKGFVVEGRPAGRGSVDLPWLLTELGRYHRDVNIILELWPPPAPSLDDAIAREDRWATESIQYLRRFIRD